MAFSQSIQRGQAPITCNLCEEETKIKWKCLNCDMLMCTKCKEKIHVKFKFAKNHTIIDIKDVGIHNAELDFSDLKCAKHAEESAVMYCTTCDKLVCTSCISKFHRGHGFVEINEGINSNLEKMKNENKRAKAKLDELMERKREMSHLFINDNTKYKELMEKIDVNKIDLKSAIDRYVDELKCELDTKWCEFQKEEKNKVEKVVNNLQELSSNADDIIKSKDAISLFVESEKLSRAVNLAEIGLGTMLFLPGQLSPYNVGSLQVVFNNVEVRIVKEFQTDISEVFFLSFCPDNSLWITDNRVLQKVKPGEHRLTIESTFNINVHGMAVTLTGDLLLDVGETVLKQISGRTGELTDSIYRLNQLYFTAMHVNKDGKVIVGIKSGGKEKGRRALIVMNQTGEHETIYEYDKNNIAIFTYVKNITITDKGNICVVDELSEDRRGRVVILGPHGDILQIYTGHSDINSGEESFKPLRIVTTLSDNVIVKVSGSDILHILNNRGHLITQYDISDIGISGGFFSLCFTRTAGQLYIGGAKQKELGKGILSFVNISGC